MTTAAQRLRSRFRFSKRSLAQGHLANREQAGGTGRRRLRLESLEKRIVLDAVISEILASNVDGLRDEDGDTSDWVEIYNPTLSPIEMSGWSLTDDPTDIDQWVFPQLTLAPDEFLIVFASGKDRSVAGQELHANFSLTSSGEYVGLYQPTGTLASEFAPTFPEQTTNVSYGIVYRDEAFVSAGDQASYLIPSDGSLGEAWKQPTFDDGSWSSGPTGLGFGVVQPGFEITYYKAQSSGTFDGTIDSITTALDVINTPAYQAAVVESSAEVINHRGTGSGGRYDNDQPFPTQTIGVDINHFVLKAETSIEIPAAGEYTFGVNSDDGFRLTLTRGSDVHTVEFPGPRGPSDTLATFNLLQVGNYDATLVMFEAGGGSNVEFFAALGTHSVFDAANFDLVGDTAAGGLAASVAYLPGASPVVATDIESQMLGINSSAYVRIPFSVTDITTIDALRLSILYDDGFIATINGTEVARRNAPLTAPFDAEATSSRTAAEVLDVEEIVLPQAAISALLEGDNVLTFHGLNRSAGDTSFLILPQLTARGVIDPLPSYLATVTPGQANLDPVAGIAAQIAADVSAGFFDTAFAVTLTTATANATIRYTLDGSEPSETNGNVYGAPFTISATTNLRAIATKDNHVTLPSQTWSYFFLDDVLTQSNDAAPPVGWPATWKNNVVDYGIDPDVISTEGAQAVKDALLALPTWSITTDLDNLFDPTIGIYSNANQDGRDWERPVAVELIQPDGSAGFMVNAGLRIRGGFSRSDNNPKHALKLFFRGSYGDGTLEYPVHGPDGTDKFKKIDLRTAQNYSWSFGGDASNAFVADVLARYNQRDLGQPYTRSSWLHLYLNGQYWGLYQTQERAEANYADTYFGGSPDDYDVLKPERGPYTNIATDGNFAAYDRLFQQALARDGDGVTPAFVDNAAYLRAQGLNVDGTENPSYENLLDVDNLIAYMITILHGGNFDAPISNFLGNNRINNYFAIRDRTGDEGFRFFIHDSEHTLRDVNTNRNGPWEHPNFESSVAYFNPQWLHQQLMANDEYRIRFADKVQQAFFHDGLMTVDALISKLDTEASLIDQAIIAESARWGDAKREPPLLRSNWLSAIANLRNNYFPNRNDVLIDQFRNTQLLLKDIDGNYTIGVPAPLFPSIDAPEFLINGQYLSRGQVAAGSLLRLTAGEGLIYYTTDGSDPRLLGGGISSSALAYDPTAVVAPLLSSGALWKYHDQGTDLGQSWRDPSFDESQWSSGNAQLGYGDGDEATVVSFGGDPSAKQPTTYFRTDFNAPGGNYSTLALRVRRDDGIVVYLNGTEVLRNNMPAGNIGYDTPAAALATDDGNDWHQFDIDPSLLNPGSNTIAVEIHQISGTSSDISFDAELIATTQVAAPIPLDDSVPIRARVLSGGTWSALHAGDFVVPREAASTSNLRVTEISYNPHLDGNAEFIELQNITSGAGGVKIDLGSLTLTEGPNTPFIVPVTATLGPGEFALIVRSVSAFTAAHPSVDPSLILGEYSGGLSNGGERIVLLDASGGALLDIDYRDGDPWPRWADGIGGSLVLSDPAGTPVDQLDKHYRWRGSSLSGGSPGAVDPALEGVVINEVLAHTDLPQTDTIELRNTTGMDLNIGGWFLSDSSVDLLKFQIPMGTMLPAFDYITFDETDFNPTPLMPGPKDFALSGSHGDSVWLVVGDALGASVQRFVDHVDFGGTFNGVSLARLPDGSGRLAPAAQPSLGAANGPFATSEIVITEINYHPTAPSAAAMVIDPTIGASDLEFVELHNHSAAPVDLMNWRLRGESDFDFAAGQSIASAATLLIVPFDPQIPLNANRVAAFRTHYGIDASVALAGPMLPSLSNNFGLVKLQRPDMAPVDEPTVVPRVLVDEVLYDDLSPWPQSADGSGDSLQRKRAATLGNDAASWRALAPTPGTARYQVQVESITINGGQTTRSAVTSVAVVFDSLVNAPQAAFALTNVTTNDQVTGLSVQTSTTGEKTTALLTFDSGPSVIGRVVGGNTLSGGYYQLTILASGVTAQVGDAAMDDDVTFGDQLTDLFFRKYGDHDGNEVVNLFDFAAFRGTFGKSSGDAGYLNDLDGDGSGVIDLFDFAQFRANFGN